MTIFHKQSPWSARGSRPDRRLIAIAIFYLLCFSWFGFNAIRAAIHQEESNATQNPR